MTIKNEVLQLAGCRTTQELAQIPHLARLNFKKSESWDEAKEILSRYNVYWVEVKHKNGKIGKMPVVREKRNLTNNLENRLVLLRTFMETIIERCYNVIPLPRLEEAPELKELVDIKAYLRILEKNKIVKITEIPEAEVTVVSLLERL